MPQIERPGLIEDWRLSEEGFVEALVREGRIPLFTEGYAGHQKCASVWIPPRGTQPGDSYRWVNGGGGYGFWSPEGKFRGLSQLINVYLDTGASLEARVEAAREALRTSQAPQNP